jgi:hypothetical protein
MRAMKPAACMQLGPSHEQNLNRPTDMSIAGCHPPYFMGEMYDSQLNHQPRLPLHTSWIRQRVQRNQYQLLQASNAGGRFTFSVLYLLTKNPEKTMRGRRNICSSV